jgi:hypothetical protein
MRCPCLLSLCLLLGCVSLGQAVSLGEAREKFELFKEQFNKEYLNVQEEEKRFKTFEEKLAPIETHNKKENTSYKRGLTEFSDLTTEEFLGRMTYHPVSLLQTKQAQNTINLKPLSELPEEVDWRNNAIISDIQNQVQ